MGALRLQVGVALALGACGGPASAPDGGADVIAPQPSLDAGTDAVPTTPPGGGGDPFLSDCLSGLTWGDPPFGGPDYRQMDVIELGARGGSLRVRLARELVGPTGGRTYEYAVRR